MSAAPTRLFSCENCSWSTTRVPESVVILFHRCRRDGKRRRLVELPDILEGDMETRRYDDRVDWFESLFPVPPPPTDNRKAPPRMSD